MGLSSCRGRAKYFLHERAEKGKDRFVAAAAGGKDALSLAPTTRSLPARSSFTMRTRTPRGWPSHRKAPFGSPCRGGALTKASRGRSPAAGGACSEDLRSAPVRRRSRGWRRPGCPSRLHPGRAGDGLGRWGGVALARATRFCGAHGGERLRRARSTSSTRLGGAGHATPVLVAVCTRATFGRCGDRALEHGRLARYAGAGGGRFSGVPRNVRCKRSKVAAIVARAGDQQPVCQRGATIEPAQGVATATGSPPRAPANQRSSG